MAKRRGTLVGAYCEPAFVKRVDRVAKDEQYWRSDAVRALLEYALDLYERGGVTLPKPVRRKRTREVEETEGEDMV